MNFLCRFYRLKNHKYLFYLFLLTFYFLKIPSSLLAVSISSSPIANFPQTNGVVKTMSLSEDGITLYVGGSFTTIGGQNRNNLAAINTETNEVTDWNPSANNTVYTITVSGSDIFVGGEFSEVGGTARSEFAKIDVNGSLDENCNPNIYFYEDSVPATVYSIKADGDFIYIGGHFNRIGGSDQFKYLARLNNNTNCTLDESWNLYPNNTVYALDTHGDYLYAGGGFTTIGIGDSQVNRSEFAKISTINGSVDNDCNPNFYNQQAETVYTIKTTNDYIYVGGDFIKVGGSEGTPRSGLARLNNLSSCSLDNSWNPSPNGPVYTIAASGSYIYVGGDFNTIGGQSNSEFAKLDSSGIAEPYWNPGINSVSPGTVYSTVITSNHLYIGGEFNSVSGQALIDLVAFAVDSANTAGDVLINKISPLGTTEWIELFNATNSPIDLTNWSIYNADTETTFPINTGTIPKNGLLTINFDTDDGFLDDLSAAIKLLSPYSTIIDSVNYGADDIPTLADNNTIIYRQSVGSTAWTTAETIPKGWFTSNDAPATSTIDAGLGSSGVETNFGELTDHTRATDLYFEKTGFGRIQFASTLNLTDSDVVTWLQNLGSKLDLSTQNRIGLDTDTVRDLISTQATLTMYNVTLTNPKILVDNAEDTDNVVSNLVYDRTAHTLTFTAAHFTTFEAVENNSGSTPSSSSPLLNQTPACGDLKPLFIPDLFQINTTKTTAKLFFTPLPDTNQYYISFSTKPTALEHGTLVTLSREGVQNFTVNLLKPNTTYYFKVRGQNGCQPGEWSKVMKIKTNNQKYYKYNLFKHR